MRISSDERAVESFPLRLMVVAAVAAMSIVPAAEGLEALRDRDFLSRAELAVDKVVRTAQLLSMEGPGAARTFGLDLSSEGSISAVRLVIGDVPGGPYASAVVLELSSGAKLVGVAHDPPAAMTSPFDIGLVVASDRFSLAMEAVMSDGACVIRAEVV